MTNSVYTQKPYWHMTSEERGHFNHGWLDTYHSFSFGDYHNPAAPGFSVLRVINEDTVAPSTGFGMHGHQDMEIITYVLSGRLQHTDSLGNTAVIEPGTIQRMRAGTGIRHSEANPSDDTPVHLLQIWIFPDQNGLAPGYEEKSVSGLTLKNTWQRIIRPEAEGNASDESLTIRQDAHLWVMTTDGKQAVKQTLPGSQTDGTRKGWLQVISGTVTLNGASLEGSLTLSAGDSLGLKSLQDEQIQVDAGMESHVLFFDLP